MGLLTLLVKMFWLPFFYLTLVFLQERGALDPSILGAQQFSELVEILIVQDDPAVLEYLGAEEERAGQVWSAALICAPGQVLLTF